MAAAEERNKYLLAQSARRTPLEVPPREFESDTLVLHDEHTYIPICVRVVMVTVMVDGVMMMRCRRVMVVYGDDGDDDDGDYTIGDEI